ncbi:NUDIX hydrolase [Deltaproteobacteria bacterium Smac51]|nr:NUDIX hydrolase [Deltaproteobacteria bacterium Smac51]
MTPVVWPLVKDESVLKTPIFEVRRNVCQSPKDGQDKGFFVLDCPDWVQVLPITEDGRAVLVRQFRQGTRALSLELPGGVIEKGQEPLEAGQRELREETGYTSESWRHMASFKPNPAVNTNTAHFFVAEKARLTDSTEFDENEDIELVLVDLKELPGMVLRGEIDHAIMSAAISFYFMKEKGC